MDIKVFKENLYRLCKNDAFLVISLFIISLAIRGFILSHSENVNDDGILRIMSSQKWLESPHLIKQGVWLPLHFYLIALSLKIFNDPMISPRLVNLLLGSLTIIPYFYLIRLLFNRKVTIFSSIVLILYPMHVGNSVTSLSGVPFSFFVFLSLYLFFSFKERLKRGNPDVKLLVLSALVLDLANMIRYESWVLVLILTLFLYRVERRYLFIFFIISMIFPAMWMWGNYTTRGDPFFGTSVASEAQKLESLNEGAKKFTSVTSVPEILAYTLSPLITLFAFVGVIYSFRKRYRIEIATIFTIIFGIFLIKILKGEMVVNPRYTLLLGMLIIPYSYIAIEKIAVLHKYTGLKLIVFISILSVIMTGYIYNAGYFTYDYGYVYNRHPPYADGDSREVAKWLNENMKPDKNLIIDRHRWQRNYIALYSGALNPGKVNTLYLAPWQVGKINITKILSNGTYLVYSPRSEGKDPGILQQFLNLSLKCSQKRYNYSFDLIYNKKELYIYYITDAYSPQKHVDDTSPVALYRFDENNLNLACDDSGNNNDGIIKGVDRTYGKFGTGLNFSTTSTYMTVKDTPPLRGPNLTISAWIKIIDFNESLLRHEILGKKTWKNATDNAGYLLFVDPQKRVLNFKIFNNGVNSLNSNTKLNANQWYHVAITYDGSYMRLYVDGVENSNKFYTGGIGDTTGRDLTFSTSWSKGYFMGVIDEVTIWNRSLSGAEIQEIYNTPIK